MPCSKYDLCTGSLWNTYKKGTPLYSENDYAKLIAIIEPIIIANNNPFLRDGLCKIGWGYNSEPNYDHRYATHDINCFIHGKDTYDYSDSIVVNYDRKNNAKEFGYLFALKYLLYAEDFFSGNDFLYHQLRTNFSKNLKIFKDFMDVLFIQYPAFKFARLDKHYNAWLDSYDPKLALSNNSMYARLSEEESWTKINTSKTDKQIRHFFSFLHEEKNDQGDTFLSAEQVDELLRFGLAIPPFPLPEKFTLKTTKKYRKSIVEYSVYILFSKYARNFRNKTPYLKFLAYNFENFAHYNTPEKLRNWNKNFTAGKLNFNLPFNLENYYPT